MTAVLFLLAFIALALAWWDKRHAAIGVSLVTIVLGVIWFWHHVTDSIRVDL